jgi:uncharacterized protein YndB with AHSA1/START domain
MKSAVQRRILFAASVLGALVGIVILIAAIGLLLPSHHVVTVSMRLSQPPDSVWAVVRDFASYPTWWHEVRAATRMTRADGREVWLERDRHNQELPIEVLESQPPQRMVTRIADSGLPFAGTWTYEILPTPDGCSLTITEAGEVRHPIFRFISRFVLGHYGVVESFLGDLARRFDEQASITRSTPSAD